MIKRCIITHSYQRFEGDWRSNFIESLARAYAKDDAGVTVFVPYAINFNRKPINNYGVKIINSKYIHSRSYTPLCMYGPSDLCA